MFERFEAEARRAVERAQEEARSLHHGYIGPEHLLVGLATGTGPAAESLAAVGLNATNLRERVVAAAAGDDDPLDADMLRALGIDLDAVRRATEAAFGPGALDRGRFSCRKGFRSGHIPFAPASKKSLELALREALRFRHRSISPGHILLGILRAGDNAAVRVLADAGVDVCRLRDDVIERLTAAA